MVTKLLCLTATAVNLVFAVSSAILGVRSGVRTVLTTLTHWQRNEWQQRKRKRDSLMKKVIKIVIPVIDLQKLAFLHFSKVIDFLRATIIWSMTFNDSFGCCNPRV